MAPIGEKPFLEYILRYLKKSGVTSVILSVGYKWEVINNYFGDIFEEMQIHYSVEDRPLGTGGAIKKALSLVTEEEVFIVNGDTFFDVDFSELKNVFKASDAEIILSLKSMKNFDRYGCVEMKDDRIVAFTEKGYRESGNINGGIYLMKSNLLDKYETPEKFSFEELIQEKVNSIKMQGYVSDGYFIDIGIPEDYQRAQKELKNYI